MNRFSKVLTAAVVMFSLSVSTLTASAAGSANLSISPASGSKTINSTFSANVYENSGTEPVNVVETSLAFDASKLRLTSFKCSSKFEIVAPSPANGISCGTVTPKTGSQLVGTATFKALTNSGSGTITFSGAQVYSSNSNQNIWNGNTNGANFTFTNPAPAPAPTPAPAPAPAPAPKIFTITILVVDSRGNPARDAEVIFNGKTVKSNKRGKAVFSDVKSGTYGVKATKGSLSASTSVIVYEKNKTSQQFMISLPSARRTGNSALVIFGGTLSGLLAAASVVVATRKYGKKTAATAHATKAKKATGKAVDAKKSTKSAKKVKTATKSLKTEAA